MKARHFLLFVVLFGACTPASERISDSLEMFPLNREFEFVGGQNQDRIILVVKRTDEEKFSYRVEILRNYLGLPLDNGTLGLDKVENDTLNFSGGSDRCRMTIKMYESNEEPVGKRAVIEQVCKESVQSIQRNDFPPLHLRRNR